MTALAVSLYVRAINAHGAGAVAMLFAIIPAVGRAVGAVACWLNARLGSGQQREHDPRGNRGRQHSVDAVHQPTMAR
jgi:hypothetical protein